MENDVDTYFTQQISHIEQDFLTLSSSSVGKFNSRLFAFVDDLKVAISNGSLHTTTVHSAFSLANRISYVTSKYLDLEIMAERSNYAPIDETPTDELSVTVVPQAASEPTNLATSTIRLSYTWLLANLHNPYPSMHTRDDIARRSGAQRKDIDSWFIDARKRIGWNALRRASFDNKRSKIVDAATRFYLKEESERPVDPAVERQLLSITKRAKYLCNEYNDSYSSVDIASIARIKAQPHAEKISQWRSDQGVRAYPLLECSPKHLSLLVPDEAGGVPSPSTSNISTGRKRKGTPTRDKGYMQRPPKRTRLDTSITSQSIVSLSGLPSPASSTEEPLHPISSLAAPSLRTRKRRLSDCSNEQVLKRLRDKPMSPRLQTISNPLLLSSVSSENSLLNSGFPSDSDISLCVDELNVLYSESDWGSLPDVYPKTPPDSTEDDLIEEIHHPRTVSSLFADVRKNPLQYLDPPNENSHSLLFDSIFDIPYHTPDSRLTLSETVFSSDAFASLPPRLETFGGLPSFDDQWDLSDIPCVESQDSAFDTLQPLDDNTPLYILQTPVPPFHPPNSSDVPCIKSQGSVDHLTKSLGDTSQLCTSSDHSWSQPQPVRAEKEKRLKEVEEARRLKLELAVSDESILT